MARKKKSSKKSNKDKSNPGAAEAIDNGFILVDPARCRFQHSKIRPVFSGCGRDVTQVLEDIKSGKTNLQDLPPIQVLVGDSDDDSSIWYFSLNNRRLWILKQLRDGGYLEEQGNKVKVRVRQPKSQSERERYSIANCALNAKIMVEKPKKKKKKTSAVVATNTSPLDENNDIEDDEKSRSDNNEDNQGIKKKLVAIKTTEISTESDNDDDDDDSDSDNDNDKESRKIKTTTNYFGSMVMDSSSSDDDDDDD
jgi:hypothetical protein